MLLALSPSRGARSALALPLLLLGLAALAAPARAQSPAPPAELLTHFELPLFAHDPASGSSAASLWAVRATYKAELATHVEFTPVLGATFPRNLPVRWRTKELRCGARVLPAASAPRRTHAATRYELDHGGFVERYDVLAEGLEQSFVLAERPRDAGALAVVGSLETPLFAEPCSEAHAELLFRDEEGRAIVRLGAATAIDASGERFPMRTSYLRGELRYELDAEAIARAQFPLIVDPLLSNYYLGTSSDPAHVVESVDVEIASAPPAGDPPYAVAWTRAVSASDRDLFCSLFQSDWTGRRDLVARVDASDYREPMLAFGAATNTWTLAALLPRQASLRDFRASNPLNVTWSWVSAAAPVGGAIESLAISSISTSGSYVQLVAWAMDTDGTHDHTDLVCCFYDPTVHNLIGGTLQPAGVPAGSDFDRERVSISSRATVAGGSWVVTWRERNRNEIGGRWRVRAAQIDEFLHVTASATLVDLPGQSALEPRLSGEDGRYLLAYGTAALVDAVSPQTLRARRIDWQPYNTPALLTDRELAAPIGGLFGGTYTLGSLAYDTETRSHWCVGFRSNNSGLNGGTRTAYLAVLGHSAGITEQLALTAPLASGVAAPSACFDPALRHFAVACSTGGAANGAWNPLLGTHLARPLAQRIPYGIGCTSAALDAGLPLAGNQFFFVELLGARPSTAGFLLIGFAPLSLPLDGLPMPGCTLLALPEISLPFTTYANGNWRWSLPLPDAPPVQGDVYLQAAYVEPGANALGLVTTAGLELRVR